MYSFIVDMCDATFLTSTHSIIIRIVNKQISRNHRCLGATDQMYW